MTAAEISRVVIAPDAFKDSLTAEQASKAIAKGILNILPDAAVILCPLADGGEGTKTILNHTLEDDQVLIESAELIGMNVSEMNSKQVWQRGSSAMGEAILHAMDDGKRRFLIALGGSATNDAGLGMLMKLGLKAVDHDGLEVEPTLTGLLKLHQIDISNMDARLSQCSFTILADVMSPLCGKEGATRLYGPQKGLETSELGRVDHAIAGFSNMCSDAFDSDPSLKNGSGAAGGLAYALMLLGGEAISGADYAIHVSGLKDQLMGADWIVTGEGRSDAQTMKGKLPCRVALLAKESGIKAALLSGCIEKEAYPDLESCFELMMAAAPDLMSREAAMQQAEILLIQAASRLAERMCLKQNNVERIGL